MKTTTKLLLTFLTMAICWMPSLAKSKRALLIGISDYGSVAGLKDKWKNIHGANDVELLRPLLVEKGYLVETLVDSQATYSGILNALQALTDKCKPGDEIYIHFSMHGQPFEDLNRDEDDGWDEALIPVDAGTKFIPGVYEGEKHLVDDHIEQICDRIRYKIGQKGRLVVAIDACHSGTAVRSGNDHRGTNEGFTSNNKIYSANLTKQTNDYFKLSTHNGQSPIIVIEACRSNQVNYEYFDRRTMTKYGSLSYIIADAFNNGAIIGSDKWIEEVKTRMNQMNELKMRRRRKQDVVIEKSE